MADLLAPLLGIRPESDKKLGEWEFRGMKNERQSIAFDDLRFADAIFVERAFD
jgi:hypothetical protein